jgi:hypothetical protein
MRLFHGNFPDEVWSRLKAWAKVQAEAYVSPTIDECVACVERIATEITGRNDSLRSDVVSFYATETAEMVARFRREIPSDGEIPSAAEA